MGRNPVVRRAGVEAGQRRWRNAQQCMAEWIESSIGSQQETERENGLFLASLGYRLLGQFMGTRHSSKKKSSVISSTPLPYPAIGELRLSNHGGLMSLTKCAHDDSPVAIHHKHLLLYQPSSDEALKASTAARR